MSGFVVTGLATEWARLCGEAEEPSERRDERPGGPSGGTEQDFAAADARWEVLGVTPQEMRGLPERLRVDDELAVRFLRAARAGGAASPPAAHALLQAVMPMLACTAARDPRADIDEYVAEAWIRIMTFPTDRARRVCANIALDCLHVLAASRRRVGRERPGTLPERPVDPWASPSVPGEQARGVIDAAARMGIVNSSCRPVLLSVYAEGLGHDRTARRYLMTPVAVRARCSRATRAMRRHADALVDYLD